MKFKALVIALVLGSSSAAMADTYSFGARASFKTSFGPVVQGPVVRDHRYDERRYDDRRFTRRWNDR